MIIFCCVYVCNRCLYIAKVHCNSFMKNTMFSVLFYAFKKQARMQAKSYFGKFF